MTKSFIGKFFSHCVLPLFWLTQCTYVVFPSLDRTISKLAVLGGVSVVFAVAGIILAQFGFLDWYLKPADDGRKNTYTRSIVFSVAGFLIGAAVCSISRIALQALWPAFSASLAGQIVGIFQYFSIGMGFYIGLMMSGFTGLYNRAAD